MTVTVITQIEPNSTFVTDLSNIVDAIDGWLDTATVLDSVVVSTNLTLLVLGPKTVGKLASLINQIITSLTALTSNVRLVGTALHQALASDPVEPSRAVHAISVEIKLTAQFRRIAKTILLGIVGFDTLTAAELAQGAAVVDLADAVGEGEWLVAFDAGSAGLIGATDDLDGGAQPGAGEVEACLALPAVVLGVVFGTAFDTLDAEALSDEEVRGTVQALVVVLPETASEECLLTSALPQV